MSFQLKAVAISETNNKFLQLYAYEKSRGPGRFDDLVYLQNARVINNGDLFRFECVGSCDYFSKKKKVISNAQFLLEIMLV